ncbi:hypothetical protein AVEN_51302-1 [Araneus ventricosus]|uniref:Uncharacterized protein n=1 Tax=Araneus ventricosus TaxID=182803 RepID=A0A4Y2QL68_ARAVE|nr:hypothetical protein AVEN_51302-1 [Araneus ventricosus]
MYTKTERWAAQNFNKFDFEERLADGTLFEEDETWRTLEESPERTAKAVLSSLGKDGVKRSFGYAAEPYWLMLLAGTYKRTVLPKEGRLVTLLMCSKRSYFLTSHLQSLAFECL